MDRPRTEYWGVAAELRPLTGGHRNAAFRTLGLRRDVVFKSTRRSPAAIAWLLSVHDRARDAGFVVPRLLESRHGNLVEDGWTCETFIQGRNLGASELPGIRPLIEEFHEAAAGLMQRPGFLSSVSLLYSGSGGDVNLDAMPEEIVFRCREAWRAVSNRREAVIHGDLNTGNVLKVKDGRFALLDWDESRRDLVLFDLGQLQADDEAGRQARLCWEVACSWLVEPEHAKVVANRP